MTRETAPRDNLTVLALLGCALGLMLMASPAFIEECRAPVPEWSALFGGALLIRISLSAALHFREWQARAETVVGFWLVASPWLLQFDRLPSATAIHEAIGFAAVGFAAVEL